MIVGRDSEIQTLCDWLDSHARVLVTGVRGIGKKTLAAECGRIQSRKLRWYSAESFKTLPQVLIQDGLTPEAALISAAQAWSPQEWIVWDRFHLWDAETRRSVLSFSRSNPELPSMLFLSDQDLGQELGFDVPQLRVGPLNRSEAQSLFKHSKKESEMELLMEKSGGVPLLLRLLSHAPDSGNALLEEILKDLPDETQKLFSVLCWIDASLSLDELRSLPFYEDSAFEKLRKRLLVESIGQGFRVSQIVHDLWENSKRRHQDQSMKVAIEFLLQHDRHALVLLRCSLEAAHSQGLSVALERIRIDETELLSRRELLLLSRQLKNQKALSHSLPVKSALRFHHVLLRSLFLCSLRSEGVEHGLSLRSWVESHLPLEEAQWLWLELLSQLNRSNQPSLVQELCRSSVAKMAGVPRALSLIEWGVAQMATDPRLALKNFEDVLRQNKESDTLWKLAHAFASFQRGRALDFLDQKSEAVSAYEQASAAFEELQKPYFSSVAKLNAAWVLAFSQEPASLLARLEKLEVDAERFGYTYILAGCRLLRARLARQHLDFDRALDFVERAIELLGSHSPVNAWADALAEKCRVLHACGLRNKAADVALELAKLQEKHGNAATQKICDALSLELQANSLEPEDFLSRVEGLPIDSDHLNQYQAGLGLLNYDAEGDSRYPLKELAHLENDFLRSLQKRSTGLEDSWVRLGRLEAFLKHHPQVMDLRIATLLFQAERGQTQFLDLADSLLMKWGCDEWIKQPLRAWLNQLREPSALGDIELALMKAAPWDRNRWRLWMAKSSQPLKRFILKTDQSQVELEAIPSPLPSADLVFHESSGEVSVRGKAPKNFSRKRALRQLLSVLLTNAPRPVPKETLCAAIWGESYSPLIHDPRIYTLIQRCRESFLLKDLVIQGTGGYQFNNRYSYVLIRDNQSLGTEVNNTHSLILSCLEGFSKQGKVEVSRGELQDSTGIPEATLKRSLSKLVNDGQLQRKGSFSKVVYSLPIARR